MGERDSLHDDVKAAETLARSVRARAVAIWAATALVGPCAGWVSAKLDTKLQVDNLTSEIQQLRGSVTVLATHQEDLTKAISELSDRDPDHPGPIFILRDEVRAAHRNAVRAVGMALAHEGARQAVKRAAGDDLAERFDKREQTRRASDAANEVIATVAVP